MENSIAEVAELDPTVEAPMMMENPIAEEAKLKQAVVETPTRMENPISEAELKPFVEMIQAPKIRPEDHIVDGKQRLKPSRFPFRRNQYARARNLPEPEPGSKRRIVGGFILLWFGLTCKTCGHLIPKLHPAPGYADVFDVPGGKTKVKKHLFCPGCKSEILMEGWKIISGATEYPPGAVVTRNIIKPISIDAWEQLQLR